MSTRHNQALGQGEAMTLHNTNTPAQNVEPGQTDPIVSAGGTRVCGDFMLTGDGWELTLRYLTRDEMYLILEAARRIVR